MKSLSLSLFLVIAAVLFLQSSPTSAAIWKVDAVSEIPSAFSGFSIIFDDSDNDNEVEFSDYLFFSGWSEFSTPNQYEQLNAIPSLLISGLDLMGGSDWVFEDKDGGGGSFYIHGTYDWFTYNATSVPIPGAVWLLGSGLVGLIGIRRKLKK